MIVILIAAITTSFQIAKNRHDESSEYPEVQGI
jgi:hypothetical protein